MEVNAVVLNKTRTRGAMKSILDRSFRYTKSVDTDIRKTFARIRRERQGIKASDQDALRNVVPMPARKRTAA
jgi:hypothetical protein